MKKSELKNIIKPLVKECINEVLLQEGILSSVIAEVVSGLNANVIRESAPLQDSETIAREQRVKLDETRKKMLDAIGRDSYKGVNVFEGTTPAPAETSSKGDPMANIDPRDPGVDIANVFGSQMSNNWGKIARNIK